MYNIRGVIGQHNGKLRIIRSVQGLGANEDDDDMFMHPFDIQVTFLLMEGSK